jgi:hypothetical protein
MKKPFATGLLIGVAALWLGYPLAADSQTRKSAVQIKADSDNFVIDEGRKVYLSSFNLYTVIRGRNYFIDRLNRLMVGIPEPLVDPTGRSVFYASNTGCGFENEGMTVFRSDVYGRKKYPILGRCRVLTPVGFLRFQNREYLLITGSSESPEKDFWLYDVGKGEFVLHADGEIRELSKGRFSYGRYQDDGDFKEIGKVTIANLIKGAPPLRRLPRYPTHGLTQKSGVRVYDSDCYTGNEGPYKTIKTSGTKILIVEKCEDGGYQVYFAGSLGRVKKGALKALEFAAKK